MALGSGRQKTLVADTGFSICQKIDFFVIGEIFFLDKKVNRDVRTIHSLPQPLFLYIQYFTIVQNPTKWEILEVCFVQNVVCEHDFCRKTRIEASHPQRIFML